MCTKRVKPEMMYAAVKKRKLDVTDIGMLIWMCGVTKLDRIRNDRITGTTKVGEISKKRKKGDSS